MTAFCRPPDSALHVREVLEGALPHSAVIGAVGALHLAVVLAAKLESPQAGPGGGVRELRARAGGGPGRSRGPLRSDTLTQACELALSTLASH